MQDRPHADNAPAAHPVRMALPKAWDITTAPPPDMEAFRQLAFDVGEAHIQNQIPNFSGSLAPNLPCTPEKEPVLLGGRATDANHFWGFWRDRGGVVRTRAPKEGNTAQARAREDNMPRKWDKAKHLAARGRDALPKLERHPYVDLLWNTNHSNSRVIFNLDRMTTPHLYKINTLFEPYQAFYAHLPLPA